MRKCILFFAVLSVISCVRDGMAAEEDCVLVSVNCRPSSFGTRSSFGDLDNSLNSWKVFAFGEDGCFAGSLSSEDQGGMLLHRGVPYRFYAVGNLPGLDDPDSEQSFVRMRHSISGAEDIFADGLPMTARPEKQMVFDKGSSDVGIVLSRAVARYELRIDRTGLENSSLTVKSVEVKQSALDFSLFGTGSAATVVGDCDRTSAADATALNEGRIVSLYMLENCQGRLLPDNDDQWKKVPDNIPGRKNLCTYIEMTGIWSTCGAASDIVCRLYLGRDNCSDFNVDRNTVNDVTLVLSDEGLLKSNWKVSRHNMDDNRVLEFEKQFVEITSGDPEKKVAIISSPSGQHYSVAVNRKQLTDASLTYRKDGDNVFVSSDYEGDDAPSAYFTLMTWDGIAKGNLEVRVTGRKYAIDGLETTYVLPSGRERWPELEFSPFFPNPSQIKVESSDESVLKWEWDEEDEDQPLALKAVGPGFAWLDVTFGSFSRRVYVYVPPKYEFAGLPDSYLEVAQGMTLSCTVISVPACSIADDIKVKVSDSSVASIVSVNQLLEHHFLLGNVDFGDVRSGASFTVRGQRNGKTVLSITEGGYWNRKERNLYVLGQGTVLTIEAVLSDGRGKQTCSCPVDSEIRLGTENNHPMTVLFGADAIVTGVELSSLKKLKSHPDKDTDEYYSVSFAGKDYRIGESCENLDLLNGGETWTVSGVDCYLYFTVTFGSDDASSIWRVKFASDYVAGDD